jgi:hypothetical protein
MRTYIIAFFILAVSVAAFSYEDPTIAELAAHADSAPLDQQPDLYTKVAEQQLKNADHLYDQGKVEEAGACVRDVVTYSGKAADTSIRSGRKLKNTEIALRKMISRLRDIQRTVNFDDQAPLKAAAERLEDLRTDLLSRMFSKEKKK